MTRFALISTLLISCASTNRAGALYLSLGGTNPALAVEITYQQTSSLSFNKVVEVANPSSTNISILAWQTELKLNPIGGAQGHLKFTAVANPPNPVLSTFGGPQTFLTEPSDSLLAFDADAMGIEGSVIPAGERRNVMDVTIAASLDAHGDFELVAAAFSPPDSGSSWFPDLESGPGPFENSAPSSQAGFLLLATIHITDAYPLGDYNRDHYVTDADYLRWREDFSSTVASPGDGADGNRDSVVNAADYVLWRKQYQPAAAAIFVGGLPVPEPNTWVSTLAALAVWGGVVRGSRRCRDECAPANGRFAG